MSFNHKDNYTLSLTQVMQILNPRGNSPRIKVSISQAPIFLLDMLSLTRTKRKNSSTQPPRRDSLRKPQRWVEVSSYMMYNLYLSSNMCQHVS